MHHYNNYRWNLLKYKLFVIIFVYDTQDLTPEPQKDSFRWCIVSNRIDPSLKVTHPQETMQCVKCCVLSTWTLRGIPDATLYHNVLLSVVHA